MFFGNVGLSPKSHLAAMLGEKVRFKMLLNDIIETTPKSKLGSWPEDAHDQCIPICLCMIPTHTRLHMCVIFHVISLQILTLSWNGPIPFCTWQIVSTFSTWLLRWAGLKNHQRKATSNPPVSATQLTIDHWLWGCLEKHVWEMFPHLGRLFFSAVVVNPKLLRH